MFRLKLDFSSGCSAEFTLKVRSEVRDILTRFGKDSGYTITGYTLVPVSTSELDAPTLIATAL